MRKLKYKEVGSKEDYDSLVEGVLRTRGLDRELVSTLLSTPKESLEDWRNLENIDLGVECLLEALDKEQAIGLIVDCDNDGVASASMMYNYIKRLYPNADIRIMLHTGKQHGLSKDIIVPNDIKLLLIPDAGMNDIEQEKALVEKDIKVLVIDHHNISDDWEEIKGVITINPQSSPRYKNKSISGSGVVYKFLQAIDNTLNVSIADDYMDLAGMGCLADIMESTQLDTRYLMNCAVDMGRIKNPFLKYLIQEKILKYDKLTLTTLAWNVIPSINSVMRLGTIEERKVVFNAFISDKEEDLVSGLKIATACKGRQDRLKKKALVVCKAYIEENGLCNYPVIIVDVTDLYDDGSLNGVIANDISNEYNRPVIVIGGKGEDTPNKGSCRNTNEAMCSDFRSWCKDTELFDLCEGEL